MLWRYWTPLYMCLFILYHNSSQLTLERYQHRNIYTILLHIYIYNTFSTYTVFFTRHSCSRCKYLLYVQGFVCTSIRAADLLINLVRTGSMAEENTLEIQNHLKKEDVVRVFTMVALYCWKSIHLSSFQLLNEYVCLKVIFFVFSINLFARKQKRSLW